MVPKANELRVGIRNSQQKSTKKWKNLPKKKDSQFFMYLNSSDYFLSMIFGFLGRFWIYMGKKVLKKKDFSR